MLVLSRKEREEIVIGDTIRIMVLRTTNGGVRLGFSAPLDVPIRRSELDPRQTEAVSAVAPVSAAGAAGPRPVNEEEQKKTNRPNLIRTLTCRT